MEVTFTAIYQKIPEAEGGGFFATIVELPEVITEGRTMEEARTNLRDALELVLEDNRERVMSGRNSGDLIKEQITVGAV